MDKVYVDISALHYCKKNDTGVSPRYSYKLFCICCSIYQKMTNLTMLFNVLLTTFTFFFF